MLWRHVASNFLTLAILLLIAAAGVVAWGKRQYEGPGPLTEAICLRVEPGTNMRKVAEKLKDEGALTSAYVFRVGADYEDRTTALKAGSYLIAPGSSMRSIVETITRGGASTCGTEINYRIGIASAEMVVRELDPATQSYVEVAQYDPAAGEPPADVSAALGEPGTRLRVTLAEGVTSWQVVDALSRAPFLTGAVKDVPAEGTLAPDSYEVTAGSTRADLVSRMIAAQDQRLTEAWAARVEGLPYKTPQEALIMASIVEKETGVPEERPRVASVFLNRLAEGIKLQTDPTVIYGITKGQGVLGRGLRQSELRARTPYNTYVIDGLPPTPIANPGLDSIRAALNPETTKYLFFVADGTGGHAFAETLAEHNRNVEKWRAIEAQQGQGN